MRRLLAALVEYDALIEPLIVFFYRKNYRGENKLEDGNDRNLHRLITKTEQQYVD